MDHRRSLFVRGASVLAFPCHRDQIQPADRRLPGESFPARKKQSNTRMKPATPGQDDGVQKSPRSQPGPVGVALRLRDPVPAKNRPISSGRDAVSQSAPDTLIMSALIIDHGPEKHNQYNNHENKNDGTENGKTASSPPIRSHRSRGNNQTRHFPHPFCIFTSSSFTQPEKRRSAAFQPRMFWS